MHATTLSYIIAYAGLYSRVLPVGVALYRVRYLRGPVLIFAVKEVFSLMMVVISTFFVKENNAYLSFWSVAVDALVMSSMYGPLMPNRVLKKVVWAFGPLFCGLVLADYLWWEGPKQRGNHYLAGLECLLVGAFLIVYLRGLLANEQIQSLRRHPMFLISAGLLLVSLLVLPVYWLSPALMSYSMTLVLRAYDAMFLGAFLAHVTYAIAFWFTKDTTRYPRVVPIQ